MLHRVRLDLAFQSESDAKALIDYAKSLLPKAKNINKGKYFGEIGYIDREKCRHDETPIKPCEKVERLEVS
jgi:hypothetical protein